MELIRYLSDCYFTEEQLLAVSGIDPDELAALQQRAMMPKASYQLRIDVHCDSFFGAHQEHKQLNYYAKSYASWIGLLQSLGGEGDAFRVFAERYRARLTQLKAAGLCTDNPRLGTGLDTHLLDEWRHFLDGTYGLCTRTGLPEDIASKELATTIIREIIGKPVEQALSTRDRVCLTLAVDLLDTASGQFAPHEKERSSRHLLIDEVRKTYQL